MQLPEKDITVSEATSESVHNESQIPGTISDKVSVKVHGHAIAGDERSLESFSEGVRTAAEQVDAEGEFAVVDLPFMQSEREQMSHLHVPDEDTNWDYVGELADLEPALREYLRRFTNDESLLQLCSNRTANIVQKTVEAFGDEAAWVCIRSMPARPGSAMRWHQDGRMFQRSDLKRRQKKLAFALCGESTYLAKLNKEERVLFHEAETRLMTSNYDEEAQAGVNATVPVSSIVVPETATQGAVFTVGTDLAAAHSEPPFNLPRVFVSVVPGSRAEIQDLKEFRGL